MAKNDAILIDAIVDDRAAARLPSSKRDEAFEYFAFEQALKDLDPSTQELQEGCIDGRDDGGIDGFFIAVNGRLILDAESFTWPRANAVLEIWLITCKLHATFQQSPLDKLVASFGEILDLSREPSDLSGAYSEELLAKRGARTWPTGAFHPVLIASDSTSYTRRAETPPRSEIRFALKPNTRRRSSRTCSVPATQISGFSALQNYWSGIGRSRSSPSNFRFTNTCLAVNGTSCCHAWTIFRDSCGTRPAVCADTSLTPTCVTTWG